MPILKPLFDGLSGLAKMIFPEASAAATTSSNDTQNAFSAASSSLSTSSNTMSTALSTAKDGMGQNLDSTYSKFDATATLIEQAAEGAQKATTLLG